MERVLRTEETFARYYDLYDQFMSKQSVIADPALTVASISPPAFDALGASRKTFQFSPEITHVYNPLDYARAAWEQYVARYARAGVEAVLVGMNPGPWGMAQTGVPFGEVNIVRHWLRIDAPISKPTHEHPKRRVEGLNCKRSEVSGARLWGWARERFGSPEKFFERFFVYNYCPLMFLEESGRNFPPDKLRAVEGAQLFEFCDEALRQMVAALRPKYVIGVGGWAEGRVRAALLEGSHEATRPRSHEGSLGLPIIGRILHPSPASPAANRGWAKQAEKDLHTLGIVI